VEDKGLVSATETSNEVILECTNGAFSSIATVDARREKLIVHASPSHTVIQDEGGLIVQPLQLGSKTHSDESSMDGPTCM
jgi:hypothetical protein